LKAVVTGGAGFIGSHLVDRLVSLGFETAVIDDLSSGLREFVNPKSKLYEGSITDESFLIKVFEDFKPEVVFHLAAQIDVMKSIDDPAEDALVNIIGTLNIVKTAAVFGVSKIIFTSSAAVYGEPSEIPVREIHPLNPKSPYGAAKAAAESYLHIFSELTNFKYVVLRLSNVYGPRQGVRKPSGIVSIIIKRFLENQEVELYDPENTVRDFIYVEDVVDAFIRVKDHNSSGIFNISSGIGHTILDVYNDVKKHLDGRTLIKDPREGEIRKIILSNELARKELSWEPRFSLSEGVERTVSFWREWLS
jgi:UDP-glucose 4-epimerase